MEKNVDDILKKYGSKIDKQVTNYNSQNQNSFSRSYDDFKKSMTPEFSRYERWCKTIGNFISLNPSKKDKDSIQKQLDIAHLNLEPKEVYGFSVMILFLTLFIGILFLGLVFLIFGNLSLTFLFLLFLLGLFLFYFSSKAPERFAMKWRLKASSQMVPAILYIVIYMKHTSNLEKAIAFAAENLEEPLAMDFRKIFWDVEVKKFSTIKESLDNYLECWRDYSLEFIESFHLIESSLFEPSEGRRVEILERSLQVMLDGVYDKMLKFSHNVKSPLTNIYMLGIVLPTLTLALLPLASTLLGDMFKAYHLVLLFNVFVPFIVIYMTYNILMNRPGGSGESDLLQKNPLYYKYTNKKVFVRGFLIALPFILIGLFPVIWMQTIPLHPELVDWTFEDLGFNFMKTTSLFGILPRNDLTGGYMGPFGPLSLIMSLFFPLGIALIFIIANKLRTKEMIKEREKSKEVEGEFTSSLFQLGNRIGDGLPAEIAFGKVAESSKGTSAEGFFKLVNQNVQGYGMSVERALFDPKRGVIIFYPSHLIMTSMKILVESVKKGLKVAAKSLMSIAEYVKNIKKVNERLNDLLAEVISDMKGNMTFLAPLLSGIVVGLSGMMTLIIGNLETISNQIGSESMDINVGLGDLFSLESMIPTYWIQVIVGFYLIEIIFILTGTLVTIKSGNDDLEKTATIGENLKKGMVLYFIVGLIAIVALSLISGIALTGVAF